jgi:hypothetical protein
VGYLIITLLTVAVKRSVDTTSLVWFSLLA